MATDSAKKLNNNLVAILHHKKTDKYYSLAVIDGTTIKYEISGSPGKMAIKIIKDELLEIEEGDILQVKLGDTPLFYGYVFNIKLDTSNTLEVTAYDQIRYLKNKDYLVYSNKTASDLIKMLAEDYQLQIGDISDTKHIIERRRESNTTILDMIQHALNETLTHTKELFVLYDDFNKLMLKKPSEMEVPILIDHSTAENFKFETSIDKNTFNLIKLIYENEQTGEHKTIYAPASAEEYAKSETKKQWGILQYCDKLDKNNQNPQEKANKLLELYNRPTKRLSANKCFGDVRVKAGSLLYVNTATTGDNKVHKMLVVSVTHKFENGLHTMDLILKGDGINDK